ncbi:MAG: hypothetical protein EP340_11155 [Alphaproteobacteria bacterium]|nr:MAG: hypothetical protein EP340_11155 [Alphaproteobacteria bacterium]
MIRFRTLLSLTALVILPFLSAPAVSEKLSVNLTTHQVAITSNFTGATITLFGAIQQPLATSDDDTEARQDDLIVIVRGPSEDITVRRKERVAGIWVNRAAVTFTNVPGFYYVASTNKLENVISEHTLNREEIGTTRLTLSAPFIHNTSLTEEEIADFRAAIVSEKTRERLYGEAEGGVFLQDKTLFSMRINIPANVPVGDYLVRVLLVRDGVVVSSKSLRPSVNKTGIERMLYRFAHNWPLLYGLSAVFVALFAGWAASVIFRRG